jgi:hypothetical protein
LTYLHKSETSNAKTENGDANGHTASTRKHEELTDHDSQDVHRFPQTVSLISTRSTRGGRDGDHTCGFFDGIAWTKKDEIPYGVTRFEVDFDGKGSIVRPVDDGVTAKQDPGSIADTATIDSPGTVGSETNEEVDWNSMIHFGTGTEGDKKNAEGSTDIPDGLSDYTVMSGGLGEK